MKGSIEIQVRRVEEASNLSNVVWLGVWQFGPFKLHSQSRMTIAYICNNQA